MDRRRRKLSLTRLVGLSYLLVAVVVVGVLGFTTDPVSTKLAPTVPAVPAPQGTHLEGLPEASGVQQPEVRKSQATLLPCHGWPDGQFTQTSDPLSPACIPTWDWAKGNGGSTARGVESNVVRIGVPFVGPVHQELATYFNANYQFYGRALEFVAVGSMNTPEQLQAAAVNAAKKGVFAVIDSDLNDMGGTPSDSDQFISAMARQRVVAVASAAPQRQSSLTQSGSYGWSFLPSDERQTIERARMICTSLKGRPAALSPDYTRKTRTFAIMVDPGDENTKWLASLMASKLRGCGIDAPVLPYSGDAFDPAKIAQRRAALAQLKSDGVTSLVIIESYGAGVSTNLRNDIRAVKYQPEFVMHDSGGSQRPLSGAYVGDPNTPLPPILATYVGRAETFMGQTSPSAAAFGYTGRVSANTLNAAPQAYDSMLIVAAGIQNAGPRLTADTFAAGLEAGRYPNPGAGGPPLYQPLIGIQDGRHSYTAGTALMWLDRERRGPGETQETGFTPGLLCFGSDGKRYDESEPFPDTDEPFLTHPTCAASFGNTADNPAQPSAPASPATPAATKKEQP